MSWSPYPPLAVASRDFLLARAARQEDPLQSLELIHFHLIMAFAYTAQFKLYEACAGKVVSGPFAGMRFPRPPECSSIQELMPVSGGGFNIAGLLLGQYECELHAPIERLLTERAYDLLVDVGCSTGYYAVGMARRMPGMRVEARDTNPAMHGYVRQLASLNGVADRVNVGGEWSPQDFAAARGVRTLVFCDIEGAEVQLLDPVAAPELRTCDIIVEMHDVFDPGISAMLRSRFQDTHVIDVYANYSVRPSIPEEISVLSRHERSALFSDLRLGPTPWAVMKAKG